VFVCLIDFRLLNATRCTVYNRAITVLNRLTFDTLVEVLAYVTGLLLSACVSFCVGLYYVSCLPIFAATSAGTLGSSARCMGIGVASGG